MTDSSTTPLALQLQSLLEPAFAPGRVEVQDDSHLHAGHAGAREGSHFTVRIVSERFKGLSRVARHRLVYESLGKPLPELGIHALAIDARLPDES
jgi:BolA protein